MYIVFEGVVGTGKTTHSKFLFDSLTKPAIYTREPGGSGIADQIRTLVQGTMFTEHIHPLCEAYLYAASRAQTISKVVKPALNEGKIVISDRCFISSIAVQGGGRDLGIQNILDINKVAIQAIIPDILVYIDCPIKVGLSRTFDKQGDRHENEPPEFYEKVEATYKQILAEQKLFKKSVILNGEKSIPEIQQEIKIKLLPLVL